MRRACGLIALLWGAGALAQAVDGGALPASAVSAADAGALRAPSAGDLDAGAHQPPAASDADAGALRAPSAGDLDAGARQSPAASDVDAGAVPEDLVPPQLVEDAPLVLPPELQPSAPLDVELRLTVGLEGAVDAAELTSSPSEAIGQRALAAAQRLRFRPATLKGEPVAVVLPFVFHLLPPRPPPDAGLPSGLAVLSGRVMTKGTRDAISFATVSVADGGLAEADADGRFSLSLPPGTHQLNVQAAGHRLGEFEETLEKNQKLEVIYRLVRSYSRPYETTVVAQKDRAEVSRVHLAGPELLEVPGTRGEPLRVVMLLPGVSSIASGIAYPVVRGFTPAATGFYLDDIRIPQLYHLLLGPSVIHPNFLDSVDFFPGDAPVRYGRLTGGVIAANVAKPRDDRLHVEATVDAFEAGAFAELPIQKTGTTIALAGRFSFTGWLLALVSKSQDVTPKADFYDYQAKIDQKVGKGSLRLLAFGSSDLVGATSKTDTSTYVDSIFHRYDLKGSYPLGPGTLEAGVTAGWDEMGTYADDKHGIRVGTFLMKRWLVSGRALYRAQLAPTLQLKVGADLERQDSGIEVSTAIAPDSSVFIQPHAIGVFSGLFAELGWFRGPWSVAGGVRLDNYLLAHGRDSVGVDPRLTARYALSDALTLRAGAGLFHQAPTLLLSLPVTDVAGLKDGLQEAWQFELGADWKLPWWHLELSGSVFYNPMTRSVEKSLRQFATGATTLDDTLVARRGNAYGLELLLRLPAQGRFFGWVTYSLMRSERERLWVNFDPDGHPSPVQHAMLPFAFDETHNVNLVAGVELPFAVKFGVTLHFNSGRPENGEVSSRTSDVFTDPQSGQQQWQVRPIDKVNRLPSFFRVDARLSREWALDQVTIEGFIDVLNASYSSEVFGYTYGQDAQGAPEKRPIEVPLLLPTIGVKGTY